MPSFGSFEDEFNEHEEREALPINRISQFLEGNKAGMTWVKWAEAVTLEFIWATSGHSMPVPEALLPIVSQMYAAGVAPAIAAKRIFDILTRQI